MRARSPARRRKRGRKDRDPRRYRQAFSHEIVQRSAGRAPVAHAREQIEPAARDPIRGALVAEQLAPAAAAGAARASLAVADEPGAGDDVDSVAAQQRAGPAAHHVVAAHMTRRRQAFLRQPAQCVDQRAILAVGGKAEERKIQIRGAQRRPWPKRRSTASASKVPSASSTDRDVVGARRQVRRSDRAVRSIERQRRLGSAAVDAEVQGGASGHSDGWSRRDHAVHRARTAGLIGLLPNDSDR